MKLVWLLVSVVLLPVYPVLWLIFRLTAERCPRCDSRWRTELLEYRGAELWECHNCRLLWEVK